MKTFQSFQRIITIYLLLFSFGCNLFKTVDSPQSDEELYSRAVAQSDANNCKDSVSTLETLPVSQMNDKMKVLLGWSYLCLAGATTKKIATSLYNYSSASGNLTVVGTLGANLGEVNQTSLTNIDKAVSVFSQIENQSIRAIEMAIGKLVKSSAILGYQAYLNREPHLSKSHIADFSTCDAVNSDCLAGCNATAYNTMSAAAISDFVNTINEAITSLGSTSASELNSLATAIRNKVGGATSTARCYIFKEIVP